VEEEGPARTRTLLRNMASVKDPEPSESSSTAQQSQNRRSDGSRVSSQVRLRLDGAGALCCASLQYCC
jgi:hypothetical protein